MLIAAGGYYFIGNFVLMPYLFIIFILVNLQHNVIGIGLGAEC